MKSILKCFLISFIGTGIGLFSCTKENNVYINDKKCLEGTGNIISKDIAIAGFSEIELKSYGEVQIYKGDQLTVNVSDYSNLIDYHKVEVSGGRLIIKTYPDNLTLSNSKATFIITTPDPLYGVYLNGCGNINVMSECDKLHHLSITGSGNITMHANVVTDKLDISITGAGDVNAKGSTTDLDASIIGAGNIYLKDMIAQNAACRVAGTGQIVVRAVSNLNATIAGIGNISYYGNPRLKSSISGIGQIKCVSEN
jgi:hypothetical protein